MGILASGLAAGAVAFLFDVLLIPGIMGLAHRNSWYDTVDHRKIHVGEIPRLGGVGMFVSFLAAVCLISAIQWWSSAGAERGILEPRFLAALGGMILMHGMGLADDFRSLKAGWKLVIQIAAAVMVTSGGFLITSVNLPYLGKFTLGLAAYPVTIFWIIGIVNAINLIDGMDGLAGGISGFAALTMGIVALIQGRADAALLALALAGAIGGFLAYNLPPARIFMGDCGAYFLGFVIAMVPLLGVSKIATVGSLIIPLTLLIIPILDTGAAILRRVKEGRHPFSPDREHLHHKLLSLGLGEREILGVVYSFSFYVSVVAVTSVVLPEEANAYLVLVVWAGTILAFYSLDVLKRKSRAARREEEGSVASRDQGSAR